MRYYQPQRWGLLLYCQWETGRRKQPYRNPFPAMDALQQWFRCFVLANSSNTGYREFRCACRNIPNHEPGNTKRQRSAISTRVLQDRFSKLGEFRFHHQQCTLSTIRTETSRCLWKHPSSIQLVSRCLGRHRRRTELTDKVQRNLLLTRHPSQPSYRHWWTSEIKHEPSWYKRNHHIYHRRSRGRHYSSPLGGLYQCASCCSIQAVGGNSIISHHRL